MKRMFLILSLLIALPAFPMQTAVASSWSWNSLVSSLTNMVREKPALFGLGAVALAASAFGVYNVCKAKKPEMQKPRPHHLYPDQEYQAVTDTLKNISPNQQIIYRKFLLMLQKAAESDLFRLECMLKENMIGSVSFDCLHVWDMHTELATALPLRTIKDYTIFVRGFSNTPLITNMAVQQAHANVKTLQEAVEAFMKN